MKDEVIVVDNCSLVPLYKLAYVSDFLDGGYCRRILVREERPGLTFARLAGLRHSRGDLIVFFDDDNIPNCDYLERAERLIGDYPTVAVWGPGKVVVEWEDGVASWKHGYAVVFQAKDYAEEKFGCVVNWADYYPPGTGMVAKRTVMETYVRGVQAGALTAVDRAAGRMSSAGDAQIVWTAVKMGLCAGVSPKLRLVHFTSRRKATLGYMTRLSFGVMASGQLAFAESFPSKKESIAAALPSTAKTYAIFTREFLKTLLFARLRSGPVALAGLFGELYGKWRVAGKRPPMPLRLAAKLMRFD